ncbi:cytochrome P450 [Phellopilus nigrolimitatus]|nr:cytochrome P450 [Phellopilus nigrolimitatus]
MSLSLAQALLLSVCSYALWRVVRPFVIKTPLADIPGPPKASWWKGNFHKVFDRNGWQFHHDIVEKYGGVVKLSMLFGDEQLYVTDPLALHHIVVKDQYIYEESSSYISTNSLIYGKGLVSTLGDHHRKQRKMLNPVFSLKHMRDLIPIFYPIAHELRDILSRQVRSGAEEINVMSWMSRAALEYVGQGGLGYTFEALSGTKTNTYSEAIKLLSLTNFSLMLPRQLLPCVDNLGTPAIRKKIFEWIPYDKFKIMRELVGIMDVTSKNIFQSKKNALLEGDEAVKGQVGKGKDIMSVLLRANMDAKEEDRLPESELLGQMSTFIFAGHETTTGAVCRILHQLSLNPEVQSKLRDEVTAARKEYGDLDYDMLMGLPYLDAVCRETMRVFPPVSRLTRTTRKDVVMPLLWPIKSADGESEIKEIPLKKNTDVIISIIGANRSKKIWGEDAEAWKPERWLQPLPESVAKARLPGVYASMMTFIGGGRACIGFKFAEMEMKMVLSILLEALVFAPGPDIFWAMSMQASPVLKGQSGLYPQLPLKVSLVSH